MATSYLYKRDSSRLFIALRDNGKRFKLYLPKESQPVINDVERNVFFLEHKNNSYSFNMNGKSYACEILSRDQNRVVVKVNEVEYKFSLESIFSYLRQGLLNVDGKSGENANNIKAQMPGKIVEVFVSAGDLINEGEPVLSLEAMKMQNEINAPCTGVIRKIHVASGQSVMQGELLLEIDSIED